MKKLVILVMSMFFFCGVALAAEEKYGVVDLQEVILKVEDGKRAKAQLQKEVDKKEAELKKEKASIEKLGQEAQAKFLSEEAKLEKQKELQERIVKYQKEGMDFQTELKKKEQEMTQKITQQVSGIVEGIAKDKGLTAVFELNSSGLLYLKESVNITDEVIKQYDSKSKKGKK